MKLLCRLAHGVRLTFSWFMSMIDDLFNKHKFVRRTIVFWALAVITWAIWHTFPRLENGNLLSAFMAVIGMLSVAIGFYQWLRNKDGD